ncbi:molybdenum ABC transporter ATP-binding protein [Ottowia thiooxydans]|uniref:molybdenum ABC transporter ATP-binding protein n=1 Tax=Ottowia thiooxydans TaxID=219182 RepID=UPI003397817C
MEARARVSFGVTAEAFTLDVDLELPGQGVTAFFGPSGCGKTTLLRAIAGLEHPDPGRVRVGGDTWQDDGAGIWLPTHKRPLGYVFQEASLFSHLSVQGNLDFGLKRVPTSERRIALDQAIELLGIGHLLYRRPAQLSGGERQRVAIARALASSPRLLLMDEPLAALDAARKTELLPYFERLQRELALPILYVSHSLDEVVRLAAHLVLLKSGRVLAAGSTGNLLTRLDLPFALGENASAVIEGELAGIDTDWGLLQVRFGGGMIQCVPVGGSRPRQVGESLRLRILARDVSLTLSPAPDTSILNVLPAVVKSLTEDGTSQTLVTLDSGGTTLLARVTRKSASMLQLAVGQRVFAQVKGVAILD